MYVIFISTFSPAKISFQLFYSNYFIHYIDLFYNFEAGIPKSAKRSLLITVGYKLKDGPTYYAMEGSIAIAGAAITWLRDNLNVINNYEEVDELAEKVENSGGVFFVPAFQGLYAPYWDPNATG